MTRYDAVVIGAGLGGLSAATMLARNGLEVLLLEYWKGETEPSDRLAETCRQLARHQRIGRAYAALQLWLHRPGSDVDTGEILSLCTPRASGGREGRR